MMKLYCIPGGGTPASVFFKWRPILKGTAEIKTLDYKRDDKAVPPQTAESIAKMFFEKIRNELETTQKYAFVSSCTGSLIEYELYRKIKESGMKLPDDMIVFSAFAPNSRFYKYNHYISNENREYIRDIYLALFSGGLFENPYQTADRCAGFLIENNKSEDNLIFPDKNIVSSNCTYEQEIMLEFANNTIKMLKADWYISARYSQSEHEKCMIESRLNVIHGLNDNLVTSDESQKWKEFAAREYNFTEIDGNHNIIVNNTSACTEILSRIIKG